MEFIIMNYNEPLVKFKTDKSSFGEIIIKDIKHISNSNVINSDINSWLQHRKPVKDRANMDKVLSECGIKDLEGYLSITYALSLNDALWVKPAQSNLTWEKVNLYHNSFNKTISNLAFSGVRLYGNRLKSTSPEFTTNGMLSKCWRRINKKIYLYKAGSTGAINTGLEPYSEELATQVAKALGLKSFVEYNVINWKNRVVSRCELFTTEYIGFKSQYCIKYYNTFEELFNYMKTTEYFEKYAEMMVLDALILNVDRHLNNWGYLTDNHTGDIIDLAPIFDNGYSFIPYFYTTAKDFNTQKLEAIQYADSQVTSAGLDFILVAKNCLNKNLKSKLINLKDFELKNIKGFDKQRLALMNILLQRQIRKILS